MLTHPTLHLLTRFGLTGIAEAFPSLTDKEEVQGLAHPEWLALLLDHEATWRNNRRLALRLRKAKPCHHAVPEDIDYRAPRGLDRRLFDTLLKGDWIIGIRTLPKLASFTRGQRRQNLRALINRSQIAS
ncbi:ATP-binding protein [Bradyrhizobium ottawaense]|uniref:ATP-binding protein n=1 Tax=Bradyrhizobium ottawaense TaxID=931866 RepID=UPI001177A822|nr:ATP-binding protein [Bradyrhizobium ottawaense]